ncbi:PGRS family protein [Sorangium sp. So ce119]|uniref:PGRS family protein n=1 Tax=Sorangium sp. So ce119 TaxID=3133279 RepID=UPI003F643494
MGFQFKHDAVVLVGFIAVATAATSGCAADEMGNGTLGGYTEDKFPNEACVPSKNIEGVDPACGVWVARTGDDGNAGIPSAPLETIAKALELAWHQGKRVYLCAQEFEETLLVPGGIEIYGGLHCNDNWRWIGEAEKTTITAPEGETPLSFHGGNGVVVLEDLHVIARSILPSHTELAGRSSIAMNTSGIPLYIRRSTIEAGDGAPGAPGDTFENNAAESGKSGNFGNAACTSATVLGGTPVSNTCGTPDDRSDDSRGGTGGTGGIASGADGTNGVPGESMNGGRGEAASSRCTAGEDGEDGANGAAGVGATGFGWLFLEGYTGPLAGNGAPGKPGQGGGGGGGGKGGMGALMCPFANSAGGAGGGSGGAGGCGGLGGIGGGAGGASIAVFAGSATAHFDDVVLKTGRGGDGGDGGKGQEGGEGGPGGSGGILGKASELNSACAGGHGGRGGNGGDGGGGLGGHSIAVAFAVRVPDLKNTTVSLGEAGVGGRGGRAAYNGADGVTAEIYDIEEELGQ